MAGSSRMRRRERREQILGAAAAFAASGFAATGLDDVAAAAGISRAIRYRHFDSNADLYRAVLDRARSRLAAVIGEPDYGEEILGALLTGAAEDPDAFRLLFTHATREPEFRAESDRFEELMASVECPPGYSTPPAGARRVLMPGDERPLIGVS